MNAGVLHPASLCRPQDAGVCQPALSTLAGTAVVLAGAAALYGASFGWWRDPLQAGWAAVKMPAMLLATTGTCTLGNFMIARVIGLDIGLRQTAEAMLRTFGVAAVLLASLAPVYLFAAVSIPGPAAKDAVSSYRLLLCVHTVSVAVAGVVGNISLWRTLLAVARGRVALAARVLCAWFFLCGVTGSELSWVFSPFLARPELDIVFLNPNAFRMNMYEYLWQLLNSTPAASP